LHAKVDGEDLLLKRRELRPWKRLKGYNPADERLGKEQVSKKEIEVAATQLLPEKTVFQVKCHIYIQSALSWLYSSVPGFVNRDAIREDVVGRGSLKNRKIRHRE
jgi:hypothetical protein